MYNRNVKIIGIAAIDLKATPQWWDPEDTGSELFRNVSSITIRHGTKYQTTSLYIKAGIKTSNFTSCQRKQMITFL